MAADISVTLTYCKALCYCIPPTFHSWFVTRMVNFIDRLSKKEASLWFSVSEKEN